MTHSAADEPTPPAVVKVARDLTEIERLADELADQAEDSSNDRLMPGGKAVVSLAPVANLEAWENRYETAERLGRDTSYVLDEDDEWEPPLQTLLFWSEEWRREHDAAHDARPTIASETHFLRWCLTWAWDNEPRFEDFASDIRKARVRLEDTVHAGRRAERSRVVCDRCEAAPRLIKVYRASAKDDRWKCPSCKHLFDEDAYRRARDVQLRSEGTDRFITTREAIHTLRLLGRGVRTARRWLAPPRRVADRCLACGARWEADEYAACPAEVEDSDELCGGLLAPVHEGDVIQGYCEVQTRRTWVWWPDLRQRHNDIRTQRAKRSA